MTRLLITIACVLGVLLTATPVMAGPAWWPLVPCGLNSQPAGVTLKDDSGVIHDYTQPCNRCHLFQLVKNLIDFIFFALTPLIATLLIVIAGFNMILAGGPGAFLDGKKVFKETLMAILVMSLAWLLANTLIRSIAKDNVAQHWWQFTCTAEVKVPTVPVGIPQPAQPNVPSTGGVIDACALCPAYKAGVTAGGQSPVCKGDYTKLGIPVNDSSKTCDYGTSAMADKLHAMRSVNDDWVISEGFPPTINHDSPAHGNGTAIDLALRPTMASAPTKEDVERLALVCAAAKQAGFGTILNEYTNIPVALYPSLGQCPQPKSYTNTNGPHLHVQL
jgi:hypothetical protein